MVAAEGGVTAVAEDFLAVVEACQDAVGHEALSAAAVVGAQAQAVDTEEPAPD